MEQQRPMKSAPNYSPEGSGSQTGSESDHIVRALKRLGLPVTRKNYIELAHGRTVPDDEWGPELEAQLPRHLQEGIEDVG